MNKIVAEGKSKMKDGKKKGKKRKKETVGFIKELFLKSFLSLEKNTFDKFCIQNVFLKICFKTIDFFRFKFL